MKNFLLPVLCLWLVMVQAQDSVQPTKPPVYPGCESRNIDDLRSCFTEKVSQYVYQNFKVPEIVFDENYSGEVIVLFEVNAEGSFVVLYVDAVYQELKEETRRVFGTLPSVQPATYNGEPDYTQYTFRIRIPLEPPTGAQATDKISAISDIERRAQAEYDNVNVSLRPYEDLEYASQLNIPFTHQAYSRFDRSMNMIGTNSHTAVKPFLFHDVEKYYDLKAAKDALLKDASTGLERKLFNEHLVQIQNKDYWFTLDPIVDFQVGKDTDADFSTTFNNTRGFYIQGGLGSKLNFFASVYESQGRFAQYFNQYAESLKAFGPDPAIIPGRGIAKGFNADAYDYPVAEAYLSYSPLDFLNIQFGHGKSFIGDGYRSLLLSDVASPSPFLKLNTRFWKIKYSNTWLWLKDVRPAVVEDDAFLSKFMANHYLSWNVSKRLNLGLFESVMWTNSNDRGFDINYLNPVILYRFIEFETGQGAGNALLGASGKYKWNNDLYLYGQFILDEFSLGDIRAGDKSWRNKYGYQVGAKYFNAFKLNNLMLQLEYNRVRPYTYSHNTIILNYGHNNQSMAHLWGANFSEAIIIGRYHYGRWFGDAKFIFGSRGLDFNDGTDNFSYGGDIYRDYNDRPFDTGVEVGQGLKATVFHAELQGGYLVNPATNLKLFANISFRNFDPEAETAETFNNNTVWFNIGLRTDLFNWYFDF